MFQILVLYQIYDLHCFFHSVGCLFTLLMVSYKVQKFLNFDDIQFILFFFCCFVFGVIGKKTLANPRLGSSMTIVFLSFIALALTFRSVIHCELIFVYDIREGFNFIPLQVYIQLSQHQLSNSVNFIIIQYWKHTEEFMWRHLIYSCGHIVLKRLLFVYVCVFFF